MSWTDKSQVKTWIDLSSLFEINLVPLFFHFILINLTFQFAQNNLDAKIHLVLIVTYISLFETAASVHCVGRRSQLPKIERNKGHTTMSMIYRKETGGFSIFYKELRDSPSTKLFQNSH